MTDNEINEAVARKLDHPHSSCIENRITHSPMPECSGNIPPYSTNIEAAWEIAVYITDVLVIKVFEISHSRTSGTWYVSIDNADGTLNICEGADTAPRAICLAFLKLP